MALLRPEKLEEAVRLDLSKHKFESNEQSFACHQLSVSLLKKFEKSAESTAQAAIATFLDANSSIPEFNIWEHDEEVQTAITYARDFILRFFPQNEFYQPNGAFGAFGPGSSLGVHCTSQYDKYSAGYGYGSTAALEFFIQAVAPSSWCPIAEASRISMLAERHTAVKTITVPKNDVTDRCISIEPSLNMFLQKSISHDLEGILMRLGLDIETQPTRQRNLARQGSLDDSLATVDLRSASDTIGLSFCEFLLPDDLLFWLKEARSESCIIGGETVKLNMMSTMGNATTFPLQTLIFYSLACGVYHVLGLKPFTNKRSLQHSKAMYPLRVSALGHNENIGVFGDDIICLAPAYDLLCKVLSACGFRVNLDKSFSKGLFRESCGGDYYRGYNVRGVYIKSLEAPSDLYSAYNRLRRWSIAHSVRLRHTLELLYTSVRSPLHVPLWEADIAGFQDDTVMGSYKCLVSRPRTRKVDNYYPWFVAQLASAGYITECTERTLTVPVRGDHISVQRRFCFSGANSVKPVELSVELAENDGSPYSKEWAWAFAGPFQA